jgi:hypothetical protein
MQPHEVHQLPGAPSLVLPPKMTGELSIPRFGRDLTGEVDAAIVVDEHHITRRHLLPTCFVHRPRHRTPHDEIRAVVDLFQVLDLLRR